MYMHSLNKMGKVKHELHTLRYDNVNPYVSSLNDKTQNSQKMFYLYENSFYLSFGIFTYLINLFFSNWIIK